MPSEWAADPQVICGWGYGHQQRQDSWQYIKNKPDKWGFELFARASEDGFIHDLVLYKGKSMLEAHGVPMKSEQQAMALRLGQHHVLIHHHHHHLCRHLLHQPGDTSKTRTASTRGQPGTTEQESHHWNPSRRCRKRLSLMVFMTTSLVMMGSWPSGGPQRQVMSRSCKNSSFSCAPSTSDNVSSSLFWDTAATPWMLLSGLTCLCSMPPSTPTASTAAGRGQYWGQMFSAGSVRSTCYSVLIAAALSSTMNQLPKWLDLNSDMKMK